MLLSSTTDKVELVSSSTADLDYKTFYVIAEIVSSVLTPKGADSKVGLINTAATTDISGSPALAADRWALVKISVRNKHASASNDVTIRYVKAAGTAREELKVTLYAGEELIMDERGMWTLYDATGGIRMGATAATSSSPGLVELADQAEMEAGTDTTRAVTPAMLRYHIGVVKFSVKVGITGNILGPAAGPAGHNVTSVTDGGLGDLTVTIADDFSGTGWVAGVAVSASSATLSLANNRHPTIYNASQAAGSVRVECRDSAATPARADPEFWYVFGLGDL